ncbi:MAG TPA: hypothetical protein VGF77_12255 [Allosphingosinicella sp.]|jgi:hypothetical protein
MLRILSWTALLLGLLILGVYFITFLDLLRLARSFGTVLIWSVLSNNPHMILGPALGMILVVLAACGFAASRRRP